MKLGIVLGLVCLLMSFQVFSNCQIKRKNNGYFFIEQNGNPISNNYSAQSSAVAGLQQLRQSGVCQFNINQTRACSIQRDNNGYFFVMQGQHRISPTYSSQSQAASNLSSLKQSNICGNYMIESTVCRIVRDNNGYYHVSQDGRQISNRFSNQPAAVTNITNLRTQGVCFSDAVSTPVCSIRRNQNGYFQVIDEQGQVLSNLYSNQQSAVSNLGYLQQNNICQNNSLYTHACTIKRDSNGYFQVMQNGESISGRYSNQQSAVQNFIYLKQNSVCGQAAARNSGCQLRRDNNGYFKIKQNGNDVSNSFSSFNSAVTNFEYLESNGVCQTRHQKACHLKKDNNGYFSIEQEGQAVTNRYSNMNTALSALEFLHQKKVCNEQRQMGCQMRRNNNGYFSIHQNGVAITNNYGSQSSAITALQNLNQKKACLSAECDIKRTRRGATSRFIIVRNGYIEGRFANINGAITDLNSLENVNSCNQLSSPQACPIRQVQNHFLVFKDGRRFARRNSLQGARHLRSRLVQEGLCLQLAAGSHLNTYVPNDDGAVYTGQGEDGDGDVYVPPTGNHQVQ